MTAVVEVLILAVLIGVAVWSLAGLRRLAAEPDADGNIANRLDRAEAAGWDRRNGRSVR